MRSLILIALILAAAAPASAATRQFTVGSFERVRVTGPYSVSVAIGTPLAKATGDQRAIDQLTIEVQAGTLIVRPSRPTTGGSGDSGAASIQLVTPALKGATLAGSGDLRIDGPKGDSFELVVTGAGNARVDRLVARDVGIAAAGSGTITAIGRAERVKLQVQGSGVADASALTALDIDVTVNGSGQVRVAASRTAKVVALGAGAVTVVGRPRCTVRSGGAAQVRCGSDQQQR